VVATFARPDYCVPPYGVPPISSDEIRDGMHRYVKHTVQEVTEALRGELTEVPPVTLRTVAGSAAGALLEAAEGADLLVVGSRGHGGFSSVLLGSVGLHCALYATCPVTVVHGAERETASEPRVAEAATAAATPAPA
jgi:nucleotide-binding universal stress UspA family protein